MLDKLSLRDAAIILVVLIVLIFIIKKQYDKKQKAKKYIAPEQAINPNDVRSSIDFNQLASQINVAFSFWLFGGGDFTDRGELMQQINYLSDSEILELNNVYYRTYKKSLYDTLHNSSIFAWDTIPGLEGRFERLGIKKV